MNSIRTLHPLVQLVPAAVVAAVVMVTLPRTGPVLAEVPERLTPPADSAASAAPEPEAEPEEASPVLPYADGIYTGSSRGYGGPVKVQVTMENGRITDVQILSASHETAAFLRRAKRLTSIVLEAQTWDVDAVSEATYTSRGILGAVRNALTGEEVINPAPPQPKEPEPLAAEEFAAPSAYRDGVYTASAEGFGGPITVQVTVAGDTITDITIVSAEGENQPYFSRARRVISATLAQGTPAGVDSISGATYSSTGILNAVKLALAKAANEPEQPAETAPDSAAETTPEETVPPQYPDGVYTGTVQSPDGEKDVSVTVTEGHISSITLLPDAEGETTSLWKRTKEKLKEWFSDAPEASSASSAAAVPLTEDLKTAVQAALTQAADPQPEADPEAAASSAPKQEADAPAPEAASDPAAEVPEQEGERAE